MKSFLLAVSAALLLTACSRTNYPGSEPYPVPPGQPVPGDTRYPDQSRIPGDPNPYPTGDTRSSYPREGQTDGVVTIIRTGSVNSEGLPPGQAKKKYGGKSARVYAPGQQKKNGGAGNGIATVISVPDRYASRSNSGQLYYSYRSNTYWKQNDGYYHLNISDNNAQVYQNGDKKNKSKAKGKGKNKRHDG
jgi:hypothetical protein